MKPFGPPTMTGAQVKSALETGKPLVMSPNSDYEINQLMTAYPGSGFIGAPGARLVLKVGGTVNQSVIQFLAGSVCKDVEVWYPDIVASKPLPQSDYPWFGTIPQGAAGVVIENVRLGNTPRGFQARGLNWKFENVWGNPLLCGFNSDTGGNTGTIEGMRFNEPAYTIQSGPLWDQYLAEGVGFDIERIDTLMGAKCFVFSANIGVRIRGSDFLGDNKFWAGTAAGGCFVDGGCDNCQTALQVTAVGPRMKSGTPPTLAGWNGFTFTNFHFGNRNDRKPFIELDSQTDLLEETYQITLDNCRVITAENPLDRFPCIMARNIRLHLLGFRYETHGGWKYLLWQDKGTLEWVGGALGGDAAGAVQFGPGVTESKIGFVTGAEGRVISKAKVHVMHGCTPPLGTPVQPPDEPPVEPPPPPPPPVTTEIHVGPEASFKKLHELPWDKLANHKVFLHYGPPDASKIQIPVSGVTLEGVKSLNGDLPIIEGWQATEWAGAKYAAPTIDKNGLITVHPMPGGPKVKGVVIKGLNIRNAHNQYPYTNMRAEKVWYEPSAAGVHMRYCQDVTIEDCAIHHNGNGLFSKSGGSEFDTIRNVIVRRCSVYANGVAGSTHMHNSYIEGINTLYELNTFDSPLAIASGANIKDRGCGTVIRYNLIRSGERLLDLVEPVEGSGIFTSDPLWKGGHKVYGNIIFDTQINSSASWIHFGSDGDGPIPPPLLWFYWNTCVSQNTQAKPDWRQFVFKTNGMQTVNVANNIFHCYSPEGGFPADFYLLTDEGGGSVAEVDTNFGTAFMQPRMASGTVNGWSAMLLGSSPGFVNNASDWTLTANSPCRGKAMPLDSTWPAERPLFGWTPQGWKSRTTHLNLGACE